VSGLNYYGSTTQPLYKRLYEHKKYYKHSLKNECITKLTAFKIIEGGNFDIILVEEYPCQNKSQLERRERFYIESNECVNKNVPTRTQKEYQKANAESRKDKRIKKYNENKELLNEKSREYKKNNSNKIAEQRKEYYKANIENIKKQQNEYYRANSDKLKEYQSKRREEKRKKATN
jgi:selenocysteine-specific translation elongation factor